MFDTEQRSFVESWQRIGNQRQVGNLCTIVSSVLGEINRSVGLSGREARIKGNCAAMEGWREAKDDDLSLSLH